MINPFDTFSEDLERVLPNIVDVLNDRKSKRKEKATMSSTKHVNLSEEDEQKDISLLHKYEFKRSSKLRQSLNVIIDIRTISEFMKNQMQTVIARQKQIIECIRSWFFDFACADHAKCAELNSKYLQSGSTRIRVKSSHDVSNQQRCARELAHSLDKLTWITLVNNSNNRDISVSIQYLW